MIGDNDVYKDKITQGKLSNFTSELGATGHMDKAVDIAARISDQKIKAIALYNLHLLLSQKNKPEEALKIAVQIPTPDEKSLALERIRNDFNKLGRTVDAQAIQEMIDEIQKENR